MKKTRHAIYYHTNFGRNDGPPLYYFHNLQKLPNTEVVHLIPEGDISRFGKFDYHWWIDYGEDGLPVDHTWQIPKDGGKTIYVASDAHLDDGYRLRRAKDFDYVFFNQVKALEEYKENKSLPYVKNGKKVDGVFRITEPSQAVSWLPHAAEPDAYPHTVQLKKYDIGFIGHLQDTKNYNGLNRVDLLDRAFKEFPNFYFGTRNPQDPSKNMFEDAAKKFNQTRIVLNISIKDDLNMRLFESLSAGAFQLTNWLPTLDGLFKDGVHLATYKTYDEMVEKAKYYLKHEDKREKIAKAGHAEFMKHHTYMHRIQTILKTIS